jgi:hypothetical protein
MKLLRTLQHHKVLTAGDQKYAGEVTEAKFETLPALLVLLGN